MLIDGHLSVEAFMEWTKKYGIDVGVNFMKREEQ
jgi:hypothetical protein